MAITFSSQLAPQCLLPANTEICIVGGGIVGCLSALELAERGHRITLLEKGAFGRSQSSQNLGWIRQQGRAAVELPIMVEANALWKEMADRCQSPRLEFLQYGVSYFGKGEADAERYEALRDKLAEHGVSSNLLGTKDIRKRHPGADEHWQIGLQTPSDGRVEPRHAVTSIAAAAARAGATMVEGCTVFGVETIGADRTKVYSNWGDIEAEKLIVAAGAGTSRLLRMLGHKLPQMKIESTVIEVRDDDVDWDGCGSDGSIAFYRNSDGHIGISLCEKFTHRPGVSSIRYLSDYLPDIENSLRATRLAPPRSKGTDAPPWREAIFRSLALSRDRNIIGDQAQILRSWAGEIDILPDYLPSIDLLDDDARIIVATGFSGHGFGIAPGAARVIADLATETPTNHDLTPFRMSRFSDGSRLEPGPTF